MGRSTSELGGGYLNRPPRKFLTRLSRFHPSAASMEESYARASPVRQILADVIEADAVASHLPPEHARDLLLAMMHGLTALHMANEPERAPGTGRFGALIGEAVEVFRRSWEPRDGSK